MIGMYGLPLDVKFCTRCVISNQRPSSVVERLASPSDHKPTIAFDSDGVCSACRYAERKKTIDWAARERMLVALCEKHGRCIVPGSGGKDSMFAAHVLKTRYAMDVLTVTAAPLICTDIGRRNYKAFTRIANNAIFPPSNYSERCRESFFRFLHPFRPFIEEQKAVGPRLSKMTGIDLVFYGEPPSERGGNEHELDSPLMDPKYYPEAGSGTEVHYLGWYLPWNSQENYYYAVEHCGFVGNDQRTQGSYSKMSSLDDAIDPWHYWTTLAKFGLGRASYNASEDIRDGYITREEGVALIKKYDQEFPSRYHQQCLDYIGIDAKQFMNRVDAGRSPHLWERVAGEWTLKHAVWL